MRSARSPLSQRLVSHRYYDLILALIPLLIGASPLLASLGVPTPLAVVSGGGLAAAVIAHAIFIHPPGGRQRDAAEALLR